MSDLEDVAKGAGVDETALGMAMDGRNAKADIIELILATGDGDELDKLLIAHGYDDEAERAALVAAVAAAAAARADFDSIDAGVLPFATRDDPK
jgi:hypothetical protein